MNSLIWISIQNCQVPSVSMHFCSDCHFVSTYFVPFHSMCRDLVTVRRDITCSLISFEFKMKKRENLTVSGPVTLVGGGIDLNVLRSSGPGLFRDRRLRAWFDDDKPTLPNGFAAKSNPFLVCTNERTDTKKKRWRWKLLHLKDSQ